MAGLGGMLMGGLTGMAATGGNPLGGIVGAAGGYMASKDQQDMMNRAAGLGAGMEFKPWNVSNEFGSAAFDPTGRTATTQMGEAYKPIYESMLSKGKNYLTQPNPYADMQRQAMQGAGGFLSAAQAYDPNAAATQQYNLMKQISAPELAQQRTALQAGLFSRGQIGSTAGLNQQTAFEKAQAMKDLMREQQAYGLAQDVQNSMLQRSQGMFGFGQQLGQAPLVQGMPYLQAAQGIAGQTQNLIGVGSDLGGRSSTAANAAAQFPWQAAQNKSDATQAFWGGIMGTLPGMMNKKQTPQTSIMQSYDPLAGYG